MAYPTYRKCLCFMGLCFQGCHQYEVTCSIPIFSHWTVCSYVYCIKCFKTVNGNISFARQHQWFNFALITAYSLLYVITIIVVIKESAIYNYCSFYILAKRYSVLLLQKLLSESDMPLKKLIVAQLVKKFPATYGTGISILSSQETISSRPCLEPKESNPSHYL
jgi:hypothetical protein